MFEKMTEYTFAVEANIYGDMIAWLANYNIPYEGSLEYSLPGAKFRMITVRMKTAPALIMKDIDIALKNIRSNKRWEESKRR